MSFLKSAINQVGRDMGKVVSNQIFKDAHSTPYRNIRSSNNRQSRRVTTNVKPEFDRAIDFQTGHRPSTLIARIAGVYTVIKNEANFYISDGYLDTDESESLFQMMNRFNEKIDDICDILEIDEEANKKEINQLTKIVEKTNDLFRRILQISAEGCEMRKAELNEEAEMIKNVSFLKFVALNAIWMGKYAKTGQKDWFATILANLISLCLFPFVHVCMAIYGALTYSGANRKRKKLKEAYERMAELEGKRAETYLSIVG